MIEYTTVAMDPRIQCAQAAQANIDMRFLRLPRDVTDRIAMEQVEGALPRRGDRD